MSMMKMVFRIVITNKNSIAIRTTFLCQLLIVNLIVIIKLDSRIGLSIDGLFLCPNVSKITSFDTIYSY